MIMPSETTAEMICSAPQTTEPIRHRRTVRGSSASTHDFGTRSPITRLSSGFVVTADTR